MSYPYYSLPPELYERLPEVLRASGLDVTIKPACRWPDHLAHLQCETNDTERIITTNILNTDIKIAYSFDDSINEYVAYATLICNGKPLPKELLRHLDQLLEKHGAELK